MSEKSKIPLAKTHKTRMACGREYRKKGYVTQFCPSCGYCHSLEIDAEGILNCDSCDQSFRVLNMLEHLL